MYANIYKGEVIYLGILKQDHGTNSSAYLPTPFIVVNLNHPLQKRLQFMANRQGQFGIKMSNHGIKMLSFD
jgi:hypothetical protein